MAEAIPIASVKNENESPLDVFGEQPGLYNLYTQICLCFPVQDSSSHSDIIATLTSSLVRLSASFPWIAGQVVNEGGPTGTYKIVPFEQIPRLVIKDLQADPAIPSMDAMRRAGFPMSMLDENIICPRNTLAAMTAAEGDPAPVFLVQANFITGGLLLTFTGQHNVMDMTGQGQIIRLLSNARHNVPFTGDELANGNPDRRSIIPPLDDAFDPVTELARMLVHSHLPRDEDSSSPATPLPSPPPAPPKSSWAYFIFSPTSLAALKSLATESMVPQLGYISTDDAVSAFIWQSITRARLPRLDSRRATTFARAIDPRRFLGIPDGYVGVVQNMTYHTYVLQKLVHEPLGSVASNLRAALNPASSRVAYNTRALATFLQRSADNRRIVSVTATLDLSSDIMLSSWAKEKLYQPDFNLGLGGPEVVRRPAFAPVESLLYLMPKALDGEIAAAVCLRDEDMERLKADEQFTKYAQYIG
ncbi:hypothetical protein A1O3_04085 [Capronia epimyces CBS 606.96]|uniref:Trichothecene 3-O-acetyltransferase-like N-terminal domain-containing protein n=1 Tax=Capronia epimyces CBS 606.96 TaxID=1182542 RepID=W9Y2U1_9EURO|nr:uncharacterized protein A1O3_04085 [Capronia epimyces CBS 606.96]EXJ87127.1 hypothetical protein A1O3_04085 [Capronia epimyces CBS 606.96]